MPRLPGISQKEAVRVFKKLGYRVVRESGHLILSDGVLGTRRDRGSVCLARGHGCDIGAIAPGVVSHGQYGSSWSAGRFVCVEGESRCG